MSATTLATSLSNEGGIWPPRLLLDFASLETAANRGSAWVSARSFGVVRVWVLPASVIARRHMATSVIAATDRIKRIACRHAGDLRSSFLFEFICILPVSERKAQRENPAVVVLMEFRHSYLHTGADAEAESLRDVKRAQDDSGRQENLFISVQYAARPKHGILLKHGPNPLLDFVVDRRIENDGPAENVGATGRKVCANGGLDVPVPEALGGCKSGRKDCMTDAIWWISRRQRTTKKESYEVVTASFRRCKRSKFHLERKISKSICRGRLMRQIVGRKDADF